MWVSKLLIWILLPGVYPVRYNDVLQVHGTERTAAHGAVSCWMVCCNGRISTKLLRVIWETTAQYTGPHLFYRILTSVKNDIIRLETKVSTMNNFLVQECRRNWTFPVTFMNFVVKIKGFSITYITSNYANIKVVIVLLQRSEHGEYVKHRPETNFLFHIFSHVSQFAHKISSQLCSASGNRISSFPWV